MTLQQLLLYSSQIVALIAAIWCWKHYKNSTQKYFLHYTIFVVLIEFFAILFKDTENSNYFVYNIYILISFLFYFYWFSLVLPIQKKWIFGLISMFLGAYFLSFLNEDIMSQILHLPINVGTILLLFCIISLFSSLLTNKDEIDFLKSQKFWIATGMLIFYLGYLPIQYLPPLGKSFKLDYSFIITLLNVIYSLCLTISFYVSKYNRV